MSTQGSDVPVLGPFYSSHHSFVAWRLLVITRTPMFFQNKYAVQYSLRLFWMESQQNKRMETDVTVRLVSPIFSLFRMRIKSSRKRVYLQLHYHHTPFRGKKSSSRPPVDTSKATYIQYRKSLLHFSLSTSRLTISASTHLRNLYISKKIPSQCQYQVYTLDSSNLSLLTSTLTILGLDTSL
nr:hypothetical protein [Tanacetum cinerariifolium]